VSNAHLHLVAQGHRVAEAIPLFDRLVGLSVPGREMSVDLYVMADSHAVARYRELGVRTSYELRVPADQVAAYAAVLDPLITDPARRLDDGAGGLLIYLHGPDAEALDALASLPPVPVEIHVDELSPEAFDWRLVPTEHDHPVRSFVEWSLVWPDIPDLGIGMQAKHGGVCMLVNCVDFFDLLPDEPGYRLYISTETRDRGTPRAAHLAAAAGLSLLGEPEWY
jgi:hypothetical protein